MTALLVTLTVVLIAAFVAVLAVYLVAIGRSLRRTSGHLAKISFGVRAIERQCEPIGPSVLEINEQLTAIGTELGLLARGAERAAEQARPGR